jgi:peptidase E
MRLFEVKDIIFVAGGNTFYLLKAMRACNFEKVLRKLF